MYMLNRAWSVTTDACQFVRRHKGKFFLGSAVVGGVGLYFGVRKALRDAENEWTKFMTDEFQQTQRLSLHLRRSKEECERALFRFLPSLEQKIRDELNVDELVASLKTLTDPLDRPERNQIWEQLRLRAMTSYFVSIYAFGLLHLLIHIQLHLLGREAFSNPAEETTNQNSENRKDAQHAFLSKTMDYFLTRGLAQLLAHVQKHVTSDVECQTWKVHEKIAVEYHDFYTFMGALHREMVITPSSDDPESTLSFALVCLSPTLENACFFQTLDKLETNAQLMQYVEEIQSVVTEPGFPRLVREILDCAFELSMKRLHVGVFLDPRTPQKDVLPPLAKIIPRMNRDMTQLYGKDPQVAKHVSQLLLQLETFNGLCEDIFTRGMMIQDDGHES